MPKGLPARSGSLPLRIVPFWIDQFSHRSSHYTPPRGCKTIAAGISEEGEERRGGCPWAPEWICLISIARLCAQMIWPQTKNSQHLSNVRSNSSATSRHACDEFAPARTPTNDKAHTSHPAVRPLSRVNGPSTLTGGLQTETHLSTALQAGPVRYPCCAGLYFHGKLRSSLRAQRMFFEPPHIKLKSFNGLLEVASTDDRGAPPPVRNRLSLATSWTPHAEAITNAITHRQDHITVIDRQILDDAPAAGRAYMTSNKARLIEERARP